MLNEESRVALTNYAIEKLGKAIARSAETQLGHTAIDTGKPVPLTDHYKVVDEIAQRIVDEPYIIPQH